MESLQTVGSEVAADAERFIGELADGHDEVQLKHFIMEMHGYTDYGKYRQACREVSSRFDGMKQSAMTYDRAKAYADLYRHRGKRLREKPGEESELKANLMDMIVRRYELEMETSERLFKRQRKEFEFFIEEARKYEKLIEGKDRGKLLEEYWIARIQKMITLATIGGGNGIDAAVEMILSLPQDTQRPLLGMLDEMKFRAKVNEIGLHGAAIKALEGPSNIVTLNGKK